MIDLHMHSVASDGTWGPAALVAEACRLGLKAVALTDHDTVGGLAEFMASGDEGIKRIPGVELSCSWYSGTMHLLGLYIEPGSAVLHTLIERVQQARQDRNVLIAERLDALGLTVTLADASALAAGEVVGRPHFAMALVKKGLCPNFEDAFRRFLGNGRPAYVSRYLPLPEEVIKVIHAAGGVTIWAHPGSKLKESKARFRQTARYLQNRGLDGVEVCYSDFSADDEKNARQVAAELKLLSSGGSDFHGAHSPGILMGSGRGALQVPDEFLPPLTARANHFRSLASLPPID